MSPSEKYVAAAYGVFLFFVLVWAAIIATKLARLERETAELARLAHEGREPVRTARESAKPATPVRAHASTGERAEADG